MKETTDPAKMKKSKNKNKRIIKIIAFAAFLAALSVFGMTQVSAQVSVDIDFGDLASPDSIADSLNILLVLTVIALAPSILVLMTGFTRILIVLSFGRNALGLQQTPPNQVLIGLALFLTFFLMAPMISTINETALQPYIAEEITREEAIEAAVNPFRDFMLAQLESNPGDLIMFLNLANQPFPEHDYSEIATSVIIPAFVISEIKRAFIIGFFIYVPFLIIDMVVASTLMSLGMMMLPPAMVSMPFKLMIFMLVDGWGLVIRALMESFRAWM